MGRPEKPHKRLLTTYLEYIRTEEYGKLGEVLADDVVYHHPLADGSIEGLENVVSFLTDVRGSRDEADEVSPELEKWAIDGNRVAALGTVSTPDGTDRLIAYAEIEDGKIAYYVPALLKGFW